MYPRYSLPVSLVTLDWIHDKVVTPLTSAIDDGRSVVWLVVDHPNEGDALLEWYRSSSGADSQELEIEPDDPALAWANLFGEDGTPGILGRLKARTPCLAFGAAHLHHETLSRWIPVLELCAKAVACTFILPVHRRTTTEMPQLLDGRCAIVIPQLSSFSRAESVGVVCELLEIDGEPGLALAQVLVDAGPLNRTELAAWLEYAEGEHSMSRVPALPPPSRPRMHCYPQRVRDRSLLEAEWRTISSLIEDTDAAFAAWMGEKLFSPVRGASAPFDTFDPKAWFVGLVSYAACRYFDASEATFPSASQLAVSSDGSLRFDRAPGFLHDLRLLRTMFQHSLDWSRREDLETHDLAAAWFKKHCGEAAPRRDQWRRLCGMFLDEWKAFAEGLLRVIKQGPHAANNQLIREELARSVGRLPAHRWELLVKEACTALAIDVDVDRFLRTHHPELVADLRRSCASAAAVESVARTLVEKSILEIRVGPPINGNDLIAAGVPQGPRVRAGLAIAKRLFGAGSAMAKPELLEAVLAELAAARDG
jgi:hypothetical protein